LKKTVDLLFEETGLAIEDVAERANMQTSRFEAIALGRWTPSPTERRKVAHVFGVSAEEVAWGHTMDPRNIRYRRYGMKEEF
jgi:ribosome-binding protein aMBF1 (putative translation factor)